MASHLRSTSIPARTSKSTCTPNCLPCVTGSWRWRQLQHGRVAASPCTRAS